MKWLVTKDFAKYSSVVARESNPQLVLPVAIKPSRYERRIKRWKRDARSELDSRDWGKGNFRNLNFHIPDYLDSTERIDIDQVSDKEFIHRFERDGLPVVITGATRGWLAEENWTPQKLVDRFYNEKFKVGEDDDGKSVHVPFSYFMNYCTTSGDAAKDDSPLYIFDPNFGDRSRNNTADDIKRKKKKSDKRESDKEKKDGDTVVNGNSDAESSHKLQTDKANSNNMDASDSREDSSTRKKLKTSHEISPKSPEKTSIKLTFKTPTPTSSTTVSKPISPAKEVYEDQDVVINQISESKPTKQMLADYIIPRYFRDDLFQYTGSKRPPHRWVVIGPKRSGTGIHVDPLGTSAWNTLLTGHKRWALFPPEIPKNLVTMRGLPDHEAATWFVMVYPRLHDRSTIDHTGKTLAERLGIINLIQRPGETVFVPGGWHHLVINLDFTIGVTQNFCSVASWETVWLKTRNSRPKMGDRLLQKLQSFVDHPREGEEEKAEVFRGLVEKAKELAFVPQEMQDSKKEEEWNGWDSHTRKKVIIDEVDLYDEGSRNLGFPV
ncbi:UNVERIFIED_CONTAM: hypothetical protein HDU68_012824 [Siphonaria sp. JEL0065]|nr:hypothetical protein HDU68_012824 [Siphonaria sp. JEL0065]